MKLDFDFDNFFHELGKVKEQAKKDNKQIVYENARKFIQEQVENAPENQGHLKAGYYPAWSGLGLPGAPMTSQPYGRHDVKVNGETITYDSQGEFIDNTNDEDNPHVIISNKTVVITAEGKKREDFKKRRARGERISKEERAAVKGKRSKIAYPYLLEKGRMKDAEGQPIGQEHKGKFAKVSRKLKFEFKNFYKKNLGRRNK